MRKAIVLVSVVVFGCLLLGIAQAGEFGATAPYTKQGQFSMALGYSYLDSKLKFDSSSVNGKSEQKFSQNQFYLEGGYGFVKDWEMFLRVGAADLDAEGLFDLPGTATEDFSGSYKFFGTLGFRGEFYKTPSFGIGAFLQGSYFSDTDKTDSDQSNYEFKSMYEIDLGLDIHGKVGPVLLYTGPFAYTFRGELRDTDVSVSPSQLLATTDFREKNWFGWFGGARMPFSENFYGNLEGRYQSGWALALSIGGKF
jgi:hypothetical protein